MINFFRKTRKKLADDNKPLKYARYAIGEVVLVVIGILIAIQLNSWKIETDENVKVLKYMDGLYSDLNQDYERLNELYTFYLNKTNSIQFLIKASNQDKVLSNDELGKRFNSILDFRKFANKKSNYLSLINEGFINKLNNKTLINEIIIYYENPYLIWSTEVYGNIMESIDFNQSNIYDSRDRLIRLNTTNAIPKWHLTNGQYYTDYKKLANSKWAINILTNFLNQSNYIFNNLESYKLMNENLRKDIENHKNKG